VAASHTAERASNPCTMVGCSSGPGTVAVTRTATVAGMPPTDHRAQAHPSVPTAMHDDGAIDDDGQAAVSAALADAGADGLLVLELVGGEAATLTEDERATVLRATRRGAGGLPLVVGCGSPDPAMVTRAHRAASGGADALLAAVPPAMDRRADLLGEVAAVGLPLWLHHHPAATGAQLDPSELAALAADLSAEVVVVEAAPSPEYVAAIVAGAGLALGGLAGLFLLEELEAGASGTICGSAVPELLGEVLARHVDAPNEASERFLELLVYLRLEVGSPGLRIRKEAWRQRGVIASARTRTGDALGTVTKRSITRRLREVGVSVRDPYPGA
jgi:4-hydroxy-tetrahydrodipicolinate synthase